MRRNVTMACAIICALVSLSTTAGSDDHHPNPATAVTTPVAPEAATIDLHRYIWPTDASRRITSSFAEYRSTHFHGGIDISTNQVTGYRVFAVREGYVYRIVITANGYGKMLYVKHPDGLISTYAHLMGFNETISAVVRKEQLRRGTYAIDYSPARDAIPVRQGDVIAYTGNTGFGPPHLHFELRDSSMNPVNPLQSDVFRTPDNIPPVITRLVVTPLGYGSTIDNSSNPKYFSRFPSSHHVRILPETIRLHGDIGVGVEAQDKSDGSWSKEGIYRLELFIDDSCTYDMKLDRVPVDRTKLIDLHYDFQAISEGHGRFQKLYIEEGNDLPFYHQPQGAGIIHTEQLSEGLHQFTIACTDNSGNRTELKGTLFANHKPSFRIADYDPESITVEGERMDRIAGFAVYGKRAFQLGWTKHSLPAGRFERTAAGIVLPVNTKPYDVIKIVAQTKAGSESPPVFRFLKKQYGPARSVHIESDVLSDYVRFTLTTPGVFTSLPVLTVIEDGKTRTVDLAQTDVSSCSGWYVPSPLVEGRRAVHADAEVNGKPAAAESEFTVYPIPADHAGSWSVDNGRFTVSFDSGAVFKPLLVQVTTESSRNGTVYTLEPQDVLLNRGIQVSIIPPENRDAEHLSLYFRSSGGWLFQTSRPDSVTGRFTAVLSRVLGEFGFIDDQTPPSIGRLRLSMKGGKLNARFRYFDNLSGINPDDIKMYLDDTLVIPEIDGEHRVVLYSGDTRLDRGRHELRISVSDRASNRMTVSRTVTVR